ATSHICCHLFLFYYTNLYNKFIILPNNSKIYVPAIGNVDLGLSLQLTHILFIPEFNILDSQPSMVIDRGPFDLIHCNIFGALIINLFIMFDTSIKVMRFDNAKELALIELLQDIGSQHQCSCPYRPEQNSMVERKPQHLLSVDRSLMFQAKVPIKF
ncbi:hypothetical protein CR513_22344, partial [Mucuna pruriens]